MDMTERQQGMHAALTVLATRCEHHMKVRAQCCETYGESSVSTQMHRAAMRALRNVAEAIRVEAMLPPEMVPDVLRADYQPPSEKMDAAKVTR